MTTITRYFVMAIMAILLVSCSEKATRPVPVPVDLLERIRALPDVSAVETQPPDGFSRAFEISFAVPVDHDNPSGPKIIMNAFLVHRDEAAPMVLHTRGYEVRQNNISELACLLEANQLYVGQRYMGEDHRPSPLDWQYLTFEQSAADHHHLVSLFKQIYQGKWISTGRSKGGISATYVKYFYPDEIDAVVAFVAPFCLAIEDPRLDAYVLDAVGTEECRNFLKGFQRRILEHKDSVLVYLENYLTLSDFTYTLEREYILEIMTLDYFFTFWQFGTGLCESVPDSNASVHELFNHLAEISGPELLSVEFLNYYGPVYYQAYRQMGFYGFITDHLEDLLRDAAYNFDFCIPPESDPVHDPATQQVLCNWVLTEGSNLIFIYGGRDPWTGAAMATGGDADVLKIVEPGADHNITIASLSNRELVYTKLEQWLGIQIDRSAAAKIPYPAEEERLHWLYIPR